MGPNAGTPNTTRLRSWSFKDFLKFIEASAFSVIHNSDQRTYGPPTEPIVVCSTGNPGRTQNARSCAEVPDHQREAETTCSRPS